MPEIGIPGPATTVIGAERRQHIQRDRLHGGSGVAAMAALAADAGRDFKRVEIDGRDRVEGVDQRERVGARQPRPRARDCTMLVMFGVSLTITGMCAASITQRVICSQYSGT